MNFTEFTETVRGATTAQVGLITGERDIVPMLYLHNGEHTDGILVDPAWMQTNRQMFVESFVIPYVELHRPQFVAWSFTGWRGPADGEWDHETAVALSIERERHETWLARLVRHDNRASLGAWRPWPANQQEGVLLSTIQEAMR